MSFSWERLGTNDKDRNRSIRMALGKSRAQRHYTGAELLAAGRRDDRETRAAAPPSNPSFQLRPSSSHSNSPPCAPQPPHASTPRHFAKTNLSHLHECGLGQVPAVEALLRGELDGLHGPLVVAPELRLGGLSLLSARVERDAIGAALEADGLGEEAARGVVVLAVHVQVVDREDLLLLGRAGLARLADEAVVLLDQLPREGIVRGDGRLDHGCCFGCLMRRFNAVQC